MDISTVKRAISPVCACVEGKISGGVNGETLEQGKRKEVNDVDCGMILIQPYLFEFQPPPPPRSPPHSESCYVSQWAHYESPAGLREGQARYFIPAWMILPWFQSKGERAGKVRVFSGSAQYQSHRGPKSTLRLLLLGHRAPQASVSQAPIGGMTAARTRYGAGCR